MTDPRLAQLTANLAAVRERIAAACRAVQREPDEIHLIVVTKTYPAADVLRLVQLGVLDFGENKDQEAAPKAAEVAAAGVAPRWHFVGHLQRNKVRSVVRYADMIHSVDSLRLVVALDAAVRAQAKSHQDLLVQVSLDGDTSRGGVAVAELDGVLEAVAAAEGLRLRGLMAVAPLEVDADQAFADLQRIAEGVRERYPEATVLSAGMSGDLEQAIRHGATHVRVGTAVLGQRPPLR